MHDLKGYDLKFAGEAICCTNIPVVSARNAVKMVDGPSYEVALGQQDGLVSLVCGVARNKAFPCTMMMVEIIKCFESKGFCLQEMAALFGAQTVGFSHGS
ncbi:hypothetical protein Nepgr_032984 [Nepenthes gracilis]|uniref:peroxidase n=1 Tax=Nepenthes gracilis TaxID=150966 RepID=A0AAD3Y8Q3_NEPGR|nr:hypothetical protein Nepgr_032984 [Nepenthes gracilis]